MDIETLRSFCLQLPACTEDVKWENNLVFSVGGKMFCSADLEPPFACSFKVKEEEFEEMGNRPGCMPAPYLARAKWITATHDAHWHKNEWEYYLRQSYELVKARLPKKIKSELGLT